MGNFYRFFSCKEEQGGGYRDINALKDSYLWFSSTHDFNDPFEGLYTEQLTFRQAKDISDDEVKQMLFHVTVSNGKDAISNNSCNNTSDRDPVWLFYQKSSIAESCKSSVEDMLKLIKDTAKVCCFNRDWGETKAFHNKLMWSHYANGLRGMCLEFDSTQLDSSLESLNNSEIQGGVVNYSGLTKLDALKLMLDYAKNKNHGVASVLLQKCKEWEYEQEHRLVSTKNQMMYNKESIKTIFIGQKMNKNRRKQLIKTVNQLGLTDKLKVATIDRESFNIKIESYNEALFID